MNFDDGEGPTMCEVLVMVQLPDFDMFILGHRL